MKKTLQQLHHTTSISFAVALIAVVCTLLVRDLLAERRNLLNEQRLALQSQTELMCERTSNLLRQLDFSLSYLHADLALLLSSPELRPLAPQEIEFHLHSLSRYLLLNDIRLSVYNGQGVLLASHGEGPAAPPQVLLPHYFQDSWLNFLFEAPVLYEGAPYLLISRAIRASQGDLVGTAQALVRPARLEQILRLNPDFTQAHFLNADGLLINAPVAPGQQPRHFRELPRYQALPDDALLQQGVRTWQLDTHQVALCQLREFPLRLLTSQDLSAALSTWYQSLVRDVLIVLVMLGALLFYLTMTRRYRQTLEHERRRRRNQIAFQDTLIDTIPNAIFYRDLEGRYLGGNSSFCRLFELSREQLPGLHLSDLFTPERAQEILADDWRLLQQGGSQELEISLRQRQHGKRVYVVHKALFRDSQGVPQGIVGVMSDITERKRQTAQLEALANLDPLTGLLNRRSFHQAYAKALSRASASAPVAFIMLDIDHFKRVNDTYGHDVGDLVLKACVDTVRTVIRKQDIFGRLGGEEFALVLPNITPAAAQQVAKKIRQRVEQTTIAAGGQRLSITISLGVALAADADTSLDALLKQADLNLYHAKQTGRNRVVCTLQPIATLPAQVSDQPEGA